jgi:glucose-6-phosphate 1-dehydrogenase
MSLGVNISGPGNPFALESVELDRDLAPQDLSAYARLEPILEAWPPARVPLGTYPAGTAQPAGGTDFQAPRRTQESR